MRTLAVLLFFAAFVSLAAAHAEYQSGFGNVSVNLLDWTTGTEGKSDKKDFVYLELEGGANFNWGEIYGFFDLENPGKTGNDVRSASKGSINYLLGGTKIGLYAQVYNFAAHGFSEQNRVLGLSYTFAGEGWWWKPFLGAHDVSQTFYSGSNGAMGGWVLGYAFKFFGENFLFVDWHEYEFERHRTYAAGNGARLDGHNGAASIWWFGPGGLSLGIQGRYANDKLGTPGSLGAVIYSVKYLF
jgi:hypothetical protein